MPSRKSVARLLVEKDARALLASRAWWIMLVLTGPLVGLSFISAVRIYGEASGVGGSAGGVGEAFSPLAGIWAPTFGAYEIVADFLLPFVAIALVAGDRQSGADKLERQRRMSPLTPVAANALVLAGGCAVCALAGLAGIGLWLVYGGSAYAPEIVTVMAGHLLNAWLAVAIAAAAATVVDNASSAAILTLSITIGSWVVNFIAGVHGGLWESVAAYTPQAMVAGFQRGLVELNVVLTAVVLAGAGLGAAAIWRRTGIALRRRAVESVALVAGAIALIAASTFVRISWDASEDRRNSFPEADERTLRAIPGPLTIDAHLAPEDGRRVDLERRALSKLRRVRPDTLITYHSATSVGLFEQTQPGYGEITYDLNGRRATSRLTTPEGVLETIYGLAGVTPPAEGEEIFRGHPLAATPRGAAWVFYLAWPAIAIAAAYVNFRRT